MTDDDMTPRSEALAMMAAALGEPAAYFYRYSDPFTGRPLWRHDGRPWNGQEAQEVKPLYAMPDDALAALDRAKEEAKQEEREAIFAVVDDIGYHCISCGHVCGDPQADLKILRKAGAKACCPEREMEPLSATLTAMLSATRATDTQEGEG